MTKQESPIERFRGQTARTLGRLGVSRRARLEWAVRAVQANQAGMTPGEREDFCRELGMFAWGVHGAGAEMDAQGDVTRPASEATGEILRGMDAMLTAAAARESIPIGRRMVSTRLLWWKPTGRYMVMPQKEGFNWWLEARETLGRLLEEFGHLVRVCGAPRPRKADIPCGTLFVAARPGQEFCSPRCQARAATRRFREAKKTVARKRAKKGAKS